MLIKNIINAFLFFDLWRMFFPTLIHASLCLNSFFRERISVFTWLKSFSLLIFKTESCLMNSAFISSHIWLFFFFFFKRDCIAVLINENRFTLRPLANFFLFDSGAAFTGKDDGFPTNLLYRKRYLVAKSLMLPYKMWLHF